MTRAIRATVSDAAERKALGRRVKQFYRSFNKADWAGCFALIDPQLARSGKVEIERYAELMGAFKAAYGCVNPWMTRLSLHLEPTHAQRDKRAFAYVYIVWQDEKHGFHMFRERWVKDERRWFTRVVGLVPNIKFAYSQA